MHLKRLHKYNRQKFIQAQLVAKAAAKKGQERLDNIKQAEQDRNWAKEEAEAIKNKRAFLQTERIENHRKRKWAVALIIIGLLIMVGGAILPFLPLGISMSTLFFISFAMLFFSALPLAIGSTLGGFSMSAMHPKMIFTVKEVEDDFKHGEEQLNKREQKLAEFIKINKIPTITIDSSTTTEQPIQPQNSATTLDPSKTTTPTTTNPKKK
jgi:hypothetical protein